MTDKNQRIEHLCNMMRAMEYVRGETPKALALEWGLTTATVRADADTAAQIVRREFTDPDAVACDVGVALSKTLRAALAEGDHRAVVAAATAYASITGAKAADRSEVSVSGTWSPADAAAIVRAEFGKVTHAPDDQDS